MSADCPDFDAFERLVTGELSGPESDAISLHASTCAECGRRLGAVRENLDDVGPLQRVMRRRAAGTDAAGVAAPTQVGPFRIIDEIGRGGMGVVYRAEQANPRRHVAVKLLHPGFGTDGRFERMFQREAHVLARLAHSDIAVVHEAGKAADGRSFLAMELVTGRPLDEYVEHAALPPASKLALFLRICRAVAYAHQRGVIHRDLKPSNVLISDAGEPKVLDFGLAKLLEPDEGETNATVLAEDGRIQGTLPYMSPEQVQGRITEIDVRSDVYSLGVILHELLSGKLPYPIDRRRLADSARTICEAPPQRLTGVDGSLRVEAEAIIRKAMEKEPDCRYSSAAAMADDIHRLLTGQPILARPPTFSYQFRKLVGRHRIAALATTAALILLVGLSVYMSILYAEARSNLIRATKAEALANDEAARARHEADVSGQIRDFLVGIFRVSDPDVGRGGTVTARELLDRAAENVERQMSANPLLKAELIDVIGDVYASLGLYEEGEKHLRRAYDARRSLIPDSLELAATATSLGEVDKRLGRLDAANEELQLAMSIMRRHRGREDLHVMGLLRSLAEVQADRGDAAGAEATMREMVALLRTDPSGRYALPGALNALAGMLADREAFAEGIPFLREAIEASREMHLTVREMLLDKLEGNVAWLLANAGELDEAEEKAERVLKGRRLRLPEMHPDIATPLVTMALIQLRRGKPEAAERFLREALAIRELRLAANHPDIAETQGLLGQALLEQSRLDEAESMLLASYRIFAKEPERNGIPVARAADRLAACCAKAGRSEEAGRWQRIAAGESPPSGLSATLEIDTGESPASTGRDTKRPGER